jgi:hypothetical protein
MSTVLKHKNFIGGVAYMTAVDMSMLINTFPMVGRTLLLYVNSSASRQRYFTYWKDPHHSSKPPPRPPADASVFCEKCPSVIGVFPAEKKDER